MAGISKETRYHILGSTSVSFEVYRWVLILEDQHRRLLLRLGIVLVYPGFVSCHDAQTPGDLPPSNILSMWGAPVHSTALLLLTQFIGHPTGTTFQGSREECERLPDEILMIFCISASHMGHSIRDSIPVTFSEVTVVANQPQRSSSSNALVPDMNRLNHLKTVSLDGD